MKKRSFFTIFIVSLALLGLISTPVMATTQEHEKAPNVVANLSDTLTISGELIFAGAWRNTDYDNNNHKTESDLTLCELGLEFDAEVNEWISVHAALHYEEPLWGSHHGPDWDEAIVTIGKEKYPLYLAAGLMYVPFGSFQTHFAADPVVEAPLTLLLGETQEKAVAIGVVHEGLSVCAYGFRGHWDENQEGTTDDRDAESCGADIHYTYENMHELTIGASYISNIAESDHMEANLPEDINLKEDVDGAAVYLHIAAAGFFLEAEYVTALEHFESTELTDEFGHAAKPSAWNIEAGYNFEVAHKNLELVLKYAGSDEANALDLPKDRYGVCANLEVIHHTTVSLGYIHNEYYDHSADPHDRNSSDMILAQIAVGF